MEHTNPDALAFLRSRRSHPPRTLTGPAPYALIRPATTPGPALASFVAWLEGAI